MTLQHKGFGFDVKQVSDAGRIEGYGSVFGGSPDSYGDIVAAGAFANSLVRHKREGSMPLMLWNHNASAPPIGFWDDIAEDGKGLYVAGQLDMEDPLGVKVHRMLKAKAVRGLSIGYRTLDSEQDDKRPGIRILKEVDLFEISPVNFPAQRRAAVDNVKSYLRGKALPSLPEFEDFLREVGFSNSEAKAIAGKGLAPLLQREAGGTHEGGVDILSALADAVRA